VCVCVCCLHVNQQAQHLGATRSSAGSRAAGVPVNAPTIAARRQYIIQLPLTTPERTLAAVQPRTARRGCQTLEALWQGSVWPHQAVQRHVRCSKSACTRWCLYSQFARLVPLHQRKTSLVNAPVKVTLATAKRERGGRA
jgi:hypothetical protein